MSPSVIEALADIKRLKREVLESHQFYGYSGFGRLLGGLLALLCAILLSTSLIPQTNQAHLVVYGGLCSAAALVNYTALFLWFRRAGDYERTRLKPVLDPLPALVAGGIISVACIQRGYFDLLFGIWMVCFGVAHLAAREALDQEMSYLGLFYIAAGAVALFILPAQFLDPWPMGIVFCLGESLGGLIFLRMRGRIRDE
ncbi:MAG: hypothetical protein J0M12_17295 [Deltaproteobacteria bacterium]|nr:hypothetical protein [Deltaproteobacteria bacterium]